MITGTTINRIRRSAERGESLEVHDLIQPGLSIRATGRRISWYYRFTTLKQRDDGQKVRSAKPICAVDACLDPQRMRAVVAAGQVALRAGNDPLAAIRTKLEEVLHLPVTKVVGTPSSEQTWDFATFREEFKKSPPTELRTETINGYYRALSETQVGKAFLKKRLIEITPQDIRQVRDDIRNRGHGRQSALTIQALRTSFEWATDSSRSALSGLTEDNNPMLHVVSKRRRNERKPTNDDAISAAELIKIDENNNIVVEDKKLPLMADIGKILLLLLDPSRLPLMKRAILLLLFYSVQRRRTVASALKRALVGFLAQKIAIWVLDGGTTKSGRPHILPFSLAAWQVIDEWRQTLPKMSVWLFPGMATRRKPVADGHINVRTVNEWMYEVCRHAECSRQLNPQIVRKAFSTYLSKKGIPKADQKLILDHTEGRGSDVTEVHYNLDPKLPKKQIVMAAWNSFLEECMEVARRPLVAVHSERMEPPVLFRVSDAPQVEPSVLPLQEARWSPCKLDVPSAPSMPPGGAPDAARLDKLREKLDSRRSLDETLERSNRKRPVP